MMKKGLLILPLFIVPLTSCQKEIKGNSFYFDTYTETRLFEGSENDLKNIDKIFSKIDKLTDNFHTRDITNISSINSTNENVEIEPELYELLKLSFSSDLEPLKYYDPLCGSLSKKWKNSLEKGTILDDLSISNELTKMASTTLNFVSENVVKRSGESEIDLGSVSKGFALDKIKEYLDQKKYTKYLVDAGSSSILLGEKNSGENFKIKVSNLDNTFLMLKNCFLSTSSNQNQKVEIDGKTYSHIINPINGSAINENDAVVVISDKGYLGDILSTAFVNETVENIKNLEVQYKVKTIVIKNKQMIYKNESIEVVNK